MIDTAFYVEPVGDVEMRWAYYKMLRQDVNNIDSGSAIPSTSRDEFYDLSLVCPPYEIQKRFGSLLAPVWKRQAEQLKQSITLGSLRDALLPKLISGDLRVRDTRHLIEVSK